MADNFVHFAAANPIDPSSNGDFVFDLPTRLRSFTAKSGTLTLATRDNLSRWGYTTNDKCSHCCQRETALHVLNGCTVALNQGRYTWRHDSILSHLAISISSRIDSAVWEFYADLPKFSYSAHATLPYELLNYTASSRWRPDMVAVNRRTVFVVLMELTVPFESNIGIRHQEKDNRYLELREKLKTAGHPCVQYSIEVGSRGTTTADNATRLKDLFHHLNVKLNNRQLTKIKRNLNYIALSCSMTIFHHRKSGRWHTPSFLKRWTV